MDQLDELNMFSSYLEGRTRHVARTAYSGLSSNPLSLRKGGTVLA